MKRAWRAAAAVLASLGLCIQPAKAGPPYVTDDPEPTRTGGWENYLYGSGPNLVGGTAGQAGVELNAARSRTCR